MPKRKYQNLSILLIKDRFQTIKEVIKSDEPLNRFEIPGQNGILGHLFIKPSSPHPPKWATFFSGIISPSDIGSISSVSAAFLLEIKSKIFAITFGQGRHILKTDSWVDRFGLKVVLNSIDKDRLRTIDKQTFDAISRQSKEQASKEANALDFGFDLEQDLLRAVTGVPKNRKIGKRIYGMDSLSVSTDTTIDKIKPFLKLLHDKYEDDSYKKDFPWVDHIAEIKDKSLISNLEDELFNRISEGNTEKIWMAVPEVIEWEKVGGFCYLLGQRSPEHPDIHLPDCLESWKSRSGSSFSKDTFFNRKINCVDNDGYVQKEWKVKKCIYCEIEIENQTFLLTAGRWYQIEKDFVKNVNQFFASIPNYDKTLPEYEDDSEGKYNERVCRLMPNDFALLDQNNIPWGGGHSKVEFCDLFSSDNDIIHVKRYGSSSVLSHLFAQGKVSGELFQMEQGFRLEVNERLPEGFKIPDPNERPESGKYQIVFAIISDVAGDLAIPFFSRLNLKNCCRTLHGLGYRVSKSKIGVEERKRKTKILRKRKRNK